MANKTEHCTNLPTLRCPRLPLYSWVLRVQKQGNTQQKLDTWLHNKAAGFFDVSLSGHERLRLQESLSRNDYFFEAITAISSVEQYRTKNTISHIEVPFTTNGTKLEGRQAIARMSYHSPLSIERHCFLDQL